MRSRLGDKMGGNKLGLCTVWSGVKNQTNISQLGMFFLFKDLRAGFTVEGTKIMICVCEGWEERVEFTFWGSRLPAQTRSMQKIPINFMGVTNTLHLHASISIRSTKQELTSQESDPCWSFAAVKKNAISSHSLQQRQRPVCLVPYLKKRTNICLFQKETPKLLLDFIHFLPRTISSSKLDTNHMSHMDACVTWCKFAVLNAALLTSSHLIRSAPLPF